jgi:hypothetical protein
MDASRGTAWLSVFASTGTLICCALPALMVAIGAGAALSSLVSVVPQLVWLSEHKDVLFAVAGVMLLAAGVAQWRARTAPCPIDPQLRVACLRTRTISRRVYIGSVVLFGIGGFFAYLAPLLLI